MWYFVLAVFQFNALGGAPHADVVVRGFDTFAQCEQVRLATAPESPPCRLER